MTGTGGGLRTIYLAGPEVFHPDAAALGEAKRALCAEHGFEGLYPFGATTDAKAIYAHCLRLMHDADCGIFNLTPFRGPSADVGTAFELGAMAAMGKPVFAYTNVAADLIVRLREEPGLAFDAAAACWRDPLGMAAEDFSNADNLMLDGALAAQGRRIHRRAVPVERRFTDLDGFAACLAETRVGLGPR